MTVQKYILRKLQRHTMSPEKREALAKFNATQVYKGNCRKCGAPWSGLLGDIPKTCPACNHGH